MAQRDAMIAAQNGACLICCQPFGRARRRWPCVDHDHATGRIRGILCHACNIGIAKLGESVENLARAIEYLR